MFDSDGREGCGLDYENGGDYYREAGGPEVVCPEDTVTGEAWFWGTHEALAITVSSSFSSSSWEITVRSAAGEIAKKVGEFKPEPVGDFGRPLAPLTKSGQGPIYLCVRLDYGSKATFLQSFEGAVGDDFQLPTYDDNIAAGVRVDKPRLSEIGEENYQPIGGWGAQDETED